MATSPANPTQFRPIFLAFSLCGLVATALGSLIVLYIYAFASMVDPRLQGIAHWQKVLEGMFLTLSVVPTVFGLTLALGGAFAAVWFAAVAIGWVATTPTRRTWAIILIGLLAMLAIAIVIVELG